MVKIIASLLAADVTNIAEEVKKLEQSGIDGIHVDIMDGHYVANFSFGPQIIHSLSKLTSLSIDAHLEIENSDNFIDLFTECGSSTLTIHPECCCRIEDVLKKIKKRGLTSSIALSPAIPVSQVKKFLPLADTLLIMTVNPGFGGQPFMREMVAKIKEAKSIITSLHLDIKIAVDGGIDKTTAPVVVNNGAEILIIGTALFQQPAIKECLNLIHQSIRKELSPMKETVNETI
jgi:ribulose-phosphate 3-epimerase